MSFKEQNDKNECDAETANMETDLLREVLESRNSSV